MRMMLGLGLAGCSACPVQAPVIFDTTEALSEDTRSLLAHTWTDWVDTAGAGRVCIDEIIVVEGEDSLAPGQTVQGRPSELRLGIDTEFIDRDLRWGLCDSLAKREIGIDDTAPEPIIGPDSFAWACQFGAPDWWTDDSKAACNTDGLSAVDAWLQREVYVHKQPRQATGVFEVAPMERIPTDLRYEWEQGISFHTLVVVDGQLVAHTSEPAAMRRRRHRFDTIDLHTGARTPYFEQVVHEDVTVEAHGGDQLVVEQTRWAPEWTVALHTVDGRVTELGRQLQLQTGHVVGRTLYTFDFQFEETPLLAVDAGTGMIREIELPQWPGLHTLSNGLIRATPDGDLLFALLAAEVDIDYDFIVVTAHHHEVWRYSPRSDRWTRVGEDLWLGPIGTTSAGRLVGQLYNDEGGLLAAIDPLTGELGISQTTCLIDDDPWHAVGDSLVGIAWSDGPDSAFDLLRWDLDTP